MASIMNSTALKASTEGIIDTKLQDKLAEALKAAQLEAKIHKGVRDQNYNDIW
ncbi:MAG TPA: hypothetical protein VM571_00990 [Noviherbaspirillum sp.]|nr:hypothetical protein [Noviherbaspirillum sp.]